MRSGWNLAFIRAADLERSRLKEERFLFFFRSLAVADLNGDGKPDLATANNFRNQLSVLLHRSLKAILKSRLQPGPRCREEGGGFELKEASNDPSESTPS